jgi:hypothetical protein
MSSSEIISGMSYIDQNVRVTNAHVGVVVAPAEPEQPIDNEALPTGAALSWSGYKLRMCPTFEGGSIMNQSFCGMSAMSEATDD